MKSRCCLFAYLFGGGGVSVGDVYVALELWFPEPFVVWLDGSKRRKGALLPHHEAGKAPLALESFLQFRWTFPANDIVSCLPFVADDVQEIQGSPSPSSQPMPSSHFFPISFPLLLLPPLLLFSLLSSFPLPLSLLPPPPLFPLLSSILFSPLFLATLVFKHTEDCSGIGFREHLCEDCSQPLAWEYRVNPLDTLL